MNIFHVLSQGKSRLHEPAISAMLGYLLGTHKDHGLGDSFLRAFLKLLVQQESTCSLDSVLNQNFIDADVSLEEPYQLDGSRKDIDIQVSILDRDKDEHWRIIIENKIKASAANPKQLSEYYNAILEDDEHIKNLVMIFLTPTPASQALLDEFSSLTVRNGHHKAWLHWNGEEASILTILQDILAMELKGDITPINEYMRHTLKAFTLHVRSIVNSGGRGGVDLGDVVDEVDALMTNGETYRIVRRNSHQIQVYAGDEKVMAKEILRRIITERSLDVPLTGLNTRRMGKKVIDILKQSKRPTHQRGAADATT